VRILFISNLYPPHFLGGYEILCSQVVEMLKQRGHEIIVLSSDHKNKEIAATPSDNNVLRKLKVYCSFDKKASIQPFARLQTGIFNFRVTRSVLKSFKPDLVFVWSQLRLTTGSARACQRLGYQCFYTFNDDHIAGYKNAGFALSPKGLIKFLLDQTIFRFNCLDGLDISFSTSISRRLRDQICEKGVDVSNTRVIYQGIPIEKFPMRTASPVIPSRTPSILYAGQLHHYKGVHTLIKAVHLLPADRFDLINLNIAGSGPDGYLAELRGLCVSEKVRVNFMGRLPSENLPELYRQHDAFVFPSIWPEPFGLTHLEAMSSGTPVISTNDGGHGEFLVHEENALVFPKDDEKALAAQLDRLLCDGVLAEKLRLNARRMVEEKFTLARYVNDLERVLLDAAGRSSQ